MMQLRIFFALGLSATALIVIGCSKKEPMPPATSTPPAQTMPNTSKASLPAPPPAEVKQAAPAKPAVPAPAVPLAAREEMPSKPATEAKRLEAEYYNTSDFLKRTEIINKLSLIESPVAIETITRLFLNEQNAELKVELISSLTDIEGQDEQKLAVLDCAIRSNQPTDVRLAAIDILSDEEDARAMQMLQGLLNDLDEDIHIREAAKDAIEPLWMQQESELELPEEASQLEAAFNNTRDFTKRAAIIEQLSVTESPDAIDSITRLFLNERDPMLKVELIDSLMNIDGENDKKLMLLLGAIRDNQRKDVRIAAIEAMGETEDMRAIQVLQGLLKDSDKEVRMAARDAVEQLKMTLPFSKK
jgi:HEAT repeat protein